MEYVKDFRWKPGLRVKDLVKAYGQTGFQSIQLYKAGEIIYKMKSEGAKIFLTFTSNLGGTSGLRGFFAQLIELGIPDVIVTTAGTIEEDIMKALGEKFMISRFEADDIELYEKGMNRVGNLIIRNDSYERLEGWMTKVLKEIYQRKKTMSGRELLYELGLHLSDKNSILYQASRKNIPIFCPALMDGAIGFHIYLLKQTHPEFHLDIIDDFRDLMFFTTQDEKKGIIALGGGVSKHFAILSTLINGGADYAVYITTSKETSGSLTGATTSEGKSWGKIKDDSDSVTVIGDATIIFPLVMTYVLEKLERR